MTPHEKAVSAINTRLEQLQAHLREAKEEAAKQFLVQSLVVTLGAAEGLNDYIKAVGQHAQRRHADVKRTNESLGAQHTELLNAGRELLEKLKATPTDAALRKEIERAQQAMTSVQKAVRRGANALQRELAPSLATIDAMADSIRRLSGATDIEGLKRVLKTTIGHVRDLYADQPALPAKGIVQAEAWEKVAGSEIEQAAGFYDAYARAGYQTTLALEMIALAVSENPPASAEEAARRANEAAAARLKQITARFTGASGS